MLRKLSELLLRLMCISDVDLQDLASKSLNIVSR